MTDYPSRDKKVLVVFGATGAQGGSVVRSILSDPRTEASWTVRGVTRDRSKVSAKAIEAFGAETVTVSGRKSPKHATLIQPPGQFE